MGGIEKCIECIPMYGIAAIIILFVFISIILRIILFCGTYSEADINHYFENNETVDSYINSNDINSINSDDIILPKYVQFDDLTDEEIQYTVPPKYILDNAS